MREPAAAEAAPASRKPAFAALALGLALALLGYAVAFAQGMASAPSPDSGLIATCVAAGGLLLAAFGLAALAFQRLRPAAGKAALAALVLVAGAWILGILLEANS